MSMYPNPAAGGFPLDYEARQGSALAISRFLNMVYAWMCAGLALTAVVAWYVASRPDIMMNLIGGAKIWVLFVVEIVLVMVISSAVNRINATAATALFLAYSALNGITLSVIFLVYTHAVLASAFLVTAGMFGAMSIYGLVTRRDLTGLGSLLFMGLVGVVLASLLSLFWHNSAFGVILNYIIVAVFIGLTAYDSQRLKAIAVQTSGNAAMAARLSISGALMLYLDFLNLFLAIVWILGDRR